MTEQPQRLDKHPVGRPKLPETVIKELETEIQRLKHEAETANEPLEELKRLAEIVRVVQRAMKGLSADDDIFLGLINPKDIRERTRLDETALLSHSAMRIVSKEWPRLALFHDIAEMEDPYYISMDGEGRKEGILLQQAKTKMDGNMILNMPNTQGGVAQEEQPHAAMPQKKGGLRGIINKVIHR